MTSLTHPLGGSRVADQPLGPRGTHHPTLISAWHLPGTPRPTLPSPDPVPASGPAWHATGKVVSHPGGCTVLPDPLPAYMACFSLEAVPPPPS